MKQNSPEALSAFDAESGALNVIVETPKRSRNKFKWDAEHELYKLSNVLPCGSYFPYDFGFIPSTEGEDGDPVDVLLLMEEPAFPGCLVPSRLIGVIEAEQDGKERNDRLIAVAEEGHLLAELESLRDMPGEQAHEIEQFFVSYHRTEGKEFKVLDKKGPKRAKEIVKEGEERHAKKKKGKAK